MLFQYAVQVVCLGVLYILFRVGETYLLTQTVFITSPCVKGNKNTPVIVFAARCVVLDWKSQISSSGFFVFVFLFFIACAECDLANKLLMNCIFDGFTEHHFSITGISSVIVPCLSTHQGGSRNKCPNHWTTHFNMAEEPRKIVCLKMRSI